MKLSEIYDINIENISGSSMIISKNKLDELGKIILNYEDDTISETRCVKRINPCITKSFKEIIKTKGILDVYCHEPRDSHKNKNKLVFIIMLRTVGVNLRDSIKIELNKK